MNNLEDVELVTSVDLNNLEANNKPVFQFLYASQAYGTLFAIYGRFTRTPSSDNSSCTVKELDLRLVNYQGILNIGFTTHNLFMAKHQEPSTDCIYFGVRGASSIREKKFVFPEPLTVHKNQKFPLTFRRILYPLPDFEFRLETEEIKTEDETKIRTKPPSVERMPISIPPNEWFDTEFRYRSGIDQYENPLKPGMVHYQDLSIESLEAGKVFLVSPRCHQSDVNLYFNA